VGVLYSAYQWQSDLMEPMRRVARAAQALLKPLVGMPGFCGLSYIGAAWELIARSTLTHHRPPYAIDNVIVGNRERDVFEEVFDVTPFATLLHFRKEVDVPQPRVLVIAPLSGHFATLLRSTVRTLLPDHDVFLTDWHNARDIPLADGKFGFDEYVDHIIRFLEIMGPGSHMLAVCQPCAHALAAVAIMAEDNNPAQPRSMTLMAGPVDTRVNPTKVNLLATEKPIDWFEKALISTVPACFEGAGRKVYPGFVQLAAFMSMNSERHSKAHRDLYVHLAQGDTAKADAIKTFYDEYFAVLDLPAEFYLETVEKIFQDAQLAKGELMYRGRRVNPGAIRKTALLTVEGEKDDICAPGQTVAAHDLCTGLKPYMKRHHMQAGVGHYGVFSGRRWENQIYPIVRNLMLSMS
jgi:poly(3-hydroxybutyrate) depolymerase